MPSDNTARSKKVGDIERVTSFPEDATLLPGDHGAGLCGYNCPGGPTGDDGQARYTGVRHRMGRGSYAEYLRVPAAGEFATRPSSLDVVHAAALPMGA